MPRVVKAIGPSNVVRRLASGLSDNPKIIAVPNAIEVSYNYELDNEVSHGEQAKEESNFPYSLCGSFDAAVTAMRPA